MPINNYGANNPYAYNPMINQQNRLMQMEQQQILTVQLLFLR